MFTPTFKRALGIDKWKELIKLEKTNPQGALEQYRRYMGNPAISMSQFALDLNEMEKAALHSTSLFKY